MPPRLPRRYFPVSLAMLISHRALRLLPFALLFLSAWAWYITFDHSTLVPDIQDLTQDHDSHQHVLQEPPTTPQKYNVSEIWFPVTETRKPNGRVYWEAENHRAIVELLMCMERGDCRSNQVCSTFSIICLALNAL